MWLHVGYHGSAFQMHLALFLCDLHNKGTKIRSTLGFIDILSDFINSYPLAIKGS